MKTLAIVGVILCIAILIGISGLLPGRDGIIADRILPDGTRLLVVQKKSTGDLGYEVGFYFREPQKAWGWCILDHDDTSWWKGRIEYDPVSDVVQIWKGGTLRGNWDRKKQIYSRPDVKGWTTPAPQDFREPPFLDSPH